jgi:hypothetical protein
MSNDWYYAKNGERFGPITLEQIKAKQNDGDLQPTDYVWCPAWNCWRDVGSVLLKYPRNNEDNRIAIKTFSYIIFALLVISSIAFSFTIFIFTQSWLLSIFVFFGGVCGWLQVYHYFGFLR